MREMGRLANEKLAGLRDSIELYQSGQERRARQAILSGIGKQRMDDIRQVVARMDSEEDQLLAIRTASARREEWIVVVSALTILPISLALYLTFLRLTQDALDSEERARAESEKRLAAEQELRKAHSGLEHIVEERTRELRQAVFRLKEEMRVRVQAEENMRELSARLLRVQDDEHRRIARELHDSIGQTLAAVKMSAARLGDLVSVIPGASKLSQEIDGLLNEAVQQTRTISHLLHPPLLDELGLTSAARTYLEGFIQRSGIDLTFELPEDEREGLRQRD